MCYHLVLNWRHTTCNTLFTNCIRFWAAILAIWLAIDLFYFHYLVALSYSGKVTEVFPLIPSGYEMASKIVAWGVLYPPPISTRLQELTYVAFLKHNLRTVDISTLFNWIAIINIMSCVFIVLCPWERVLCPYWSLQLFAQTERTHMGSQLRWFRSLMFDNTAIVFMPTIDYCWPIVFYYLKNKLRLFQLPSTIVNRLNYIRP